MNKVSKYWIIATEEALEENEKCGLFSQREIEALAYSIETAARMESEACGHHNIPNLLVAENERLAKAVSAERDKVHCKECNGSGTIVSHGPCHSSESQCWKCRGEGRHTR